MILLLAFAFWLVLVFTGVYLLFDKAGRKGWEAIVPIYSWYVMLKLSGRPGWWVLWLLIPGINVIAVIIIYSGFIKCYGKFTLKQVAAAFFIPFIALPKWGLDNVTNYLGPSGSYQFKNKYYKQLQKSQSREWIEAIVFATVTAALIRTFFIEAYVIPSGSMESTLLVGDYLFVSKFNYGARLPVTPLAYPFAQHTLPVFNTKAYWDGVQLPYYRLPGFTSVHRGDVVVFNFPMDADPPLSRPVDKRENFIKRCQGIPGDTIALLNAQVYVNNKMAVNPPDAQQAYLVRNNGKPLNMELLKKLKIEIRQAADITNMEMLMTRQAARVLATKPGILSVNEYIAPRNEISADIFPHDRHFKWNEDNLGPVIIPKRGWTVKLDSLTIPIYKRAIAVYERNQVTNSGNKLVINGKPATTYTFKLNYYWMMGDNRHNSEDSRFWGFVPEDHIEGKALFIWMSSDSTASGLQHIRWERLFRWIK